MYLQCADRYSVCVCARARACIEKPDGRRRMQDGEVVVKEGDVQGLRRTCVLTVTRGSVLMG
jgi:hypothetical protein